MLISMAWMHGSHPDGSNLSLSCCWDGESTMVLGSRSQHSDFTSFGGTASPCESSKAELSDHSREHGPSHHFCPASAINIPMTQQLIFL